MTPLVSSSWGREQRGSCICDTMVRGWRVAVEQLFICMTPLVGSSRGAVG
jgi:hypothetical protein